MKQKKPVGFFEQAHPSNLESKKPSAVQGLPSSTPPATTEVENDEHQIGSSQ